MPPAQIRALCEIEADRLRGPGELGLRKLGTEKGRRSSWDLGLEAPVKSGSGL